MPPAALVTPFLDQSNRATKGSEQGNRDNQKDEAALILRITHVNYDSLLWKGASAGRCDRGLKNPKYCG